MSATRAGRPWLACWIALPIVAACATVTRGSSEIIEIQSVPGGALVRSSTGWTCKTPCRVEIGRKDSFALDVEKAGFETARVLVRAEIDGAGRRGLAANIVLGGLIGAAIDGASGALYSHPVNPLVIELQERTAPAAEQSSGRDSTPEPL